MARTPQRQGIETRLDAHGQERHRAYVKVEGRKVRGAWRANLAEARADRVTLQGRALAGTPLKPAAAPTGPTVRDAWHDFLRLAELGQAWTRSGGRYAPKTLRGYVQAMRDHVLPAVGDTPVHELRRSQVQAVVYAVAAEHTGQTARNAVAPLCALFRYLLGHHDDLVDPTHGLQLPKGSRPRTRVATPAELADLLAALPERDRAPLALAGLAGLRRGELRALGVEGRRPGRGRDRLSPGAGTRWRAASR